MAMQKVYFIAGFSPRKGLLGVASYLHELEDQDVEFTRFFMTLDSKWGHREFNEDIVSVCYTKNGNDWSWWLLSKRGKVMSVTPKGRFDEIISDAGTGPNKLGYLCQIKVINGELYTCGLCRQVYKRKQGQWVRMDDRVLSEDAKYGFRAMDGTAANNIHAVGYEGEIWYYNGGGWRPGASPTNITLEAIRFISPELCYICGKSGMVIRGYKDDWEVIENDSKENLWGLEHFEGKVYLSSPKGLYTIEDDRVEPLELGRQVEGRRLYSNGKELWSMEHHQIWVFDGKDWREVVCPDNVVRD